MVCIINVSWIIMKWEKQRKKGFATLSNMKWKKIWKGKKGKMYAQGRCGTKVEWRWDERVDVEIEKWKGRKRACWKIIGKRMYRYIIKEEIVCPCLFVYFFFGVYYIVACSFERVVVVAYKRKVFLCSQGYMAGFCCECRKRGLLSTRYLCSACSLVFFQFQQKLLVKIDRRKKKFGVYSFCWVGAAAVVCATAMRKKAMRGFLLKKFALRMIRW